MSELLLLAGAIILEVVATISLRMAVAGSRLWYLSVALCYAGSFALLALTLEAGMPLGVAYGIWSAVGVAIMAILGRVLFKERLTWVMGLGIALIAGGVLLIEAGAGG